MSTKPLFLLRKAKKSSGEPDVVLWARNDFESTCATLDYLIVKSGKKLSSYFKAVATNFPVVNDLPAEGEIDFTWSERYQLSKDSMTWELKPGAAPDNAHYQGNTNVNGEDMTEIEENMLLPISGQELPIRWLAQHGSEKPVTHVSRDGLQALHIARAEELPAVTALAVSHKTSLLDPLEIRELHKLVRDTDKVFPNPGNSNLGLITAFFEAYLNADYTDRGLLTKEWMKGNRVSHITRTASGANAGGGNLTDRGEGFVHDLTSLARDVATGVLARSMDLDIYNLHPAHAKRIEEIIAENKPPFSVFRDKFITMPGGLDYSRAIVVASVKEAPIGIEVIPAHVTEYLNKVLTETDHANPDPEIVDIACGRSSAPMPQRVTEEGKQDDEEKPQPSGTTAVEQGEAETMEPDATEHHQDTQPLDAQSQVNSVDAKYQELRAELHEARKNIPSKNPVDDDKLLAASRGEFVDGISDPNDPKWVKGIQTRDCVYQNQPETEKTSPDMNQPEPVVQQEPEIACNACGQTGGDNCPDCGAVMGDATYQETFDEESQVEAKENDPEEMEGAEHPHNENAGSDPHRDCSDETGEVADPVIVEDIEPGIYYGISNENYHAGPGISKSQLDDIADTPALYLWRKNAPVDTTKTKTLDLGTAFHCRVIIGYRGMIDLARRSGQIASLSARVVREGDEFSFEFGLDEKLIHRPGENEDAPVTHVYAVARLKDGGTQFEVMTRKQIELVRSLSKAGNNGPWVTHWEEMAKKTAIRRLFKYLPVSIEIQRAVSMDEKEPLTIDPADSSVLTGEYSVIDNSEE
ncbi:exodeoxyribonuclease VIII [Escherichia coli]|nr:exodeoxyribonuclease VIII [Escherichia coli]